MKIVINKCFGGFGLSLLAEEEYAKRKGFKLYFYTQTKYSHRDGVDEYKKVPKSSKESMTHSVKVDMGATTNNLYVKDGDYFSSYDIPRDDKDLVAVVKKLKGAANGWAAELKIVEIPDGTKYEIEEYDGQESIHEEHESWG